MENIVVVPESELIGLLSSSSRTLVGKIMKRIEISQNLNQSKAEIKELIYEEFRNVKGQLESYSKGIQYYNVEILNPTSKKE